MPFATKLKKALSGFMAVVLLLRFFPWYILFLLLLNETVEESVSRVDDPPPTGRRIIGSVSMGGRLPSCS